MKVYVMEIGEHDDRRVVGVYSSAQAAMVGSPTSSVGWTKRGNGWWNGLDWDESVYVAEFELKGAAE